jgi:hypothetical protein
VVVFEISMIFEISRVVECVGTAATFLCGVNVH